MGEVSSHIVKLHTWRYFSPALRCESDSDDDSPRLRPALRQLLTLRPLVGQRVETLHLGHRDPAITSIFNSSGYHFTIGILNWAAFDFTWIPYNF